MEKMLAGVVLLPDTGTLVFTSKQVLSGKYEY
jgi:hypothetical protein